MRLSVSPQVRLVSKTSCAVVARKRFFASVDSKVPLQKPRSGKALSANVAFAGKRVGANVHLECRERSVTLVAKLARKSLLNLIGRVHLLVLDVS